jgi:hypothetical protein
MEDKVRRSIMIALVALLALAVAVPTVSAASQRGGGTQDIDEYLASLTPPFPNPFTIPEGAVCTFPVTLEQNGKAKKLELPGGGTIVAFPALTATLTNDDTGKQVTLVITGATHQTTEADGDVVTVVTGLNLLSDPIAGFVLAKGKFSFTFDAAGNLTEPLSGKGQLIDVCELLSS